MKTIGIIGGMSFESTIEYYRILNEMVNERLGGLHSAKILMESYDFDIIANLQESGEWQKLGEILSSSAKKLENTGADYIMIATNTMHSVAGAVQNSISIPLIHIADAAAKNIKEIDCKTVLLLGTKYTMKESFYTKKLVGEYGLNVIVPDEAEMDIVHNIIFDELCAGKVLDDSRQKILEIIEKYKNFGAECVVLGCTELPNLINDKLVFGIPVINTVYSHCRAAAEEALKTSCL